MKRDPVKHSASMLGVAAIALAATLLTGCASTGPKGGQTRMEVERNVGFIIVEEADIPGDVRADYRRAMSLIAAGQEAESVELLREIVERAPDLSAPRIDLAIALHRQGDLAGAEEHLRTVLAASPRHPLALNELGIVLRESGRFAEAKEAYEAALGVYPGYHFARRNLAILCDLYLADLECALQNYEAYLASVNEDKEVAIWVADIKQQMGQ